MLWFGLLLQAGLQLVNSAQIGQTRGGLQKSFLEGSVETWTSVVGGWRITEGEEEAVSLVL